jgi:hypothetical protein
MENKTKIQIKTWFGKLIFEHESSGNSVKKTLLEAIKSDANLSGANLSGVDLSGAENKETAYLPIFCKWASCIIDGKIKIGCKEKTIEEWDSFFASNEEFETSRDSKDFKQIEAVYLAYKAYYLHLNKS